MCATQLPNSPRCLFQTSSYSTKSLSLLSPWQFSIDDSTTLLCPILLASQGLSILKYPKARRKGSTPVTNILKPTVNFFCRHSQTTFSCFPPTLTGYSLVLFVDSLYSTRYLHVGVPKNLIPAWPLLFSIYSFPSYLITSRSMALSTIYRLVTPNLQTQPLPALIYPTAH